MKSARVLVIEPPNQQLPIDTARPNGALGPAYLVGALRSAGIEADYLDGTVGWGVSLENSFYRREEQENGTVRYGVSREWLAEVVVEYDVIATSSIFTAQTRMHFEIAEIVRKVNPAARLISGGVNAAALYRHFYKAGFDAVCSGAGEQFIVNYVQQRPIEYPTMNDLPLPALDALPLDTYRRLGIPHAGVLPSGMKFASIQTSRGCQDRCSFCHISMEKENGVGGFLRMFTEEQVSRCVDLAVALGVRRLYFEDDNLFFYKQRLYSLAKVLKRPGLEYSNVNGGNLRFLFDKRGHPDAKFIAMLADFGLVELVLPFESRSDVLMKKYASGKYSANAYDSAALVRALKAAGIRCQGNFMIGFADEDWESVLATKRYAAQMMDAGLDACGFMIPVPYPGSLDFERLPAAKRAKFDADVLGYTDRMHWRARPLFPTLVPGERLEAAVQEFWRELNRKEYVDRKVEGNVQQ